MTAVRSLLDWCSNSTTIVFIRDSSFGMPAVQSVHLVGLTVLLAAILVLNLRLAGVNMRDWALPAVERELRPWAWGAAALVLASGALMFLGNPGKYLASGPFQFKMVCLALGILCQFGLFRRFFRSEPGVRPRPMNIAVAGLSLTLWFAVGWAGRLIAFM
ncbi:MAG: DUF6644 family protein [Gemmatimonadaceae bacterium]